MRFDRFMLRDRGREVRSGAALRILGHPYNPQNARFPGVFAILNLAMLSPTERSRPAT